METGASDTESERWEDFFGSSTELAPSLLGFYDNLTSSFDSSFKQQRENSTSVDHTEPHSKTFSTFKNKNEEVNSFYKQTSPNFPQSDLQTACRTLSNDAHTETTSPSEQRLAKHDLLSVKGIAKQRNNIKVLSPNVQRIISHSDAEPIRTVDFERIQTSEDPLSNLSINSASKKSSPKAPIKTNHKVKHSNIPLSKVTCKLTETGNELVETFATSAEYFDIHQLTKNENRNGVLSENIRADETDGLFHFRNSKSKAQPLIVANSKSETADLKSLPKHLDGVNIFEMEKLAAAAQLYSMSIALDVNKPKEFIPAEPPLSPLDTAEAFNFSMITHSINHLGLLESNDSKDIVETVNQTVISKPLVRSSSAASASKVKASPLLTYARSKSVAAKASTLGVPMKLPTAKQLEELEEASRISAESLDRLTDIKSKFSPNESRKHRSILLSDIKLKHRPLSSASICSTSSSSSSGSELQNSKLATNYLASVESLDELLSPRSGMTVSERALLEIVDSERNYVQDLGQIIKGYFLDWKEKACLSPDELKILFSNIEDVYQFNSTLLKQLETAGMDPVKISKCFIELSDHFNVYTTYCTQYPEAISLLTKLLQATHTNNLLNSTQKQLHHTLPLGSYLLKPVQRILKYHLLLDNLRKHYDIEEVFKAYEIMRQVARNIDQVKKKLEQQSRVKELSGILDGWLGPELTVLGELRQEGLLMEHNKPRMVFLFTTMLIITKPKEDNRLQFKSYIHQNNLMLSEHLPGEPTSFYVIPYDEPRHQIKLTARNRDQKRLWAQHIKGVILEKFDIPNRAKELVYKLGDEEDRTPNKLPRKWTLHSNNSTTPTYLERRNQYRRSEMRNRNKFKRKTVATSTSFENFNSMEENIDETPRKGSSLVRNNSMDESVLPTLQKFAAAVRNKHKSVEVSPVGKCDNDILQRNSSTIKPAHNTLKQRSKSVPRIDFPANDASDDTSPIKDTKSQGTDKRNSQNKTPDIEVKQYNHKTLPKRISTLKKQKQKETSKFYLDLADFESAPETVLKITESTESLEPHEETLLCPEERSSVSTNENDKFVPTTLPKRDHQIILDLLQYKKEFEKLRNKSPKKRSSTTATPINSPVKNQDMELPPRPPSKSPPPLETDSENYENPTKKDSADLNLNEPIYETLLRNVHVPYKFSPTMARSNTSGLFKIRDQRESMSESDYVTLIYNPEGTLEPVSNDEILQNSSWPHEVTRNSSSSVSSESSSETVKRDSQNTVISLDMSSMTEHLNNVKSNNDVNKDTNSARFVPKNIMKRLLHSTSNKTSLENISSTDTSFITKPHRSTDSFHLPFVRGSKLLERRVSDVSDMCRQSIFHRQGSEAVGERIAHVDYADPKTLFLISQNAASELSLQRDSVVSLTSSNDSVCDGKQTTAASFEISMNFEYEDRIEATLETDFRDSAIYSDDNDKRCDLDIKNNQTNQLNLRSSTPIMSPPLPPPRTKKYPTIIQKLAVPQSTLKNSAQVQQSTIEHNGSRVIMCPPNLNEVASRSWVLKQIENFNK